MLRPAAAFTACGGRISRTHGFASQARKTHVVRAAALRLPRATVRCTARPRARFPDWGASESAGAKLRTHSFRIIRIGITWKGTSVFDFARTFAVASAAAAMLFMLAVTFGLIAPSSRPAGVVQAVAQQN